MDIVSSLEVSHFDGAKSKWGHASEDSFGAPHTGVIGDTCRLVAGWELCRIVRSKALAADG